MTIVAVNPKRGETDRATGLCPCPNLPLPASQPARRPSIICICSASIKGKPVGKRRADAIGGSEKENGGVPPCSIMELAIVSRPNVFRLTRRLAGWRARDAARILGPCSRGVPKRLSIPDPYPHQVTTSLVDWSWGWWWWCGACVCVVSGWGC